MRTVAEEVDDDWLREEADEAEQIDAMRRWFKSRYEDPANSTPWDGEEKKYVFVWGGPFDPNDVLQERFADSVPLPVVLELVDELWREVGDEWAPIEHEGYEYEDYVSLLIATDRRDPRLFLSQRLDEISNLLQQFQAGDDAQRRLLCQMAHGSMIAALEAYLADTTKFWIDADDSVLRKFVASTPEFQKKTVSLSSVLEQAEKIKESVNAHLSDLVWHRLPRVKEMMEVSFEIDFPPIGDLIQQVLVRHDIVHRAGRKPDGTVVEMDPGLLTTLRSQIDAFVDAIEQQLDERFPEEPTPF